MSVSFQNAEDMDTKANSGGSAFREIRTCDLIFSKIYNAGTQKLKKKNFFK